MLKNHTELISISAVNSVGRISIGDHVIINLECEAQVGSIVACLPDYRLMEYSDELGSQVIGKVVRFIINPE